MTTQVPPAIEDEAMLDDMLSQPSDELVETLAGLEGDITILGVGGKMGPTLARMAKRAAHLCWAVGAGIMTAMGLVFIAVPEQLAALLASGEDVVRVKEMAAPLLRIAGPIQCFFGTYLVLSQCLRGAGDTRGPMTITYASTFLVRLPLAFVLGYVLGFGLNGVWFGLCGELVVRGCLYIARFRGGKWQRVTV